VTRLLQAMAGQTHGGAEAFFERLAIAFQREGEEQRLVIRRDRARAARLAAARCRVIEVPFGGRGDLVTRGKLRRVIEAFQPSVALTWMNRASSMCPAGDFTQVGRLGGYYDLKYYRTCHQLVANTQDIVDYIVRSGWPAARVHHLPNFAAQQDAPPRDREPLATPDDAPLALAMGRLHPNKGFDVLLAALAQVPQLYLWLAGDGEERADLESRAASLGLAERVRFLGWQEDVGPLLAAADMLICPSRHEPLGNVVLEAWAAGVPVIASTAEGPRALVAEGETGLLVPVEDADALAAAMARLVRDPALANSLGARGRELWVSEFSEARIVPLYRSFLAEVRR
jgi:glycosyltransferase involved in cell wall biosynthesis